MSTTVIGMIVALVLIAIVWFAFVAPSEKRYHERKLRLMQERIERHRQYVEDGESQRPDDARGLTDMAKIVAKTRRLALREAQPSDVAFVLELLTEPTFLEFIGDRGVHDEASAATYLEDGPLASYRQFGYGPYVVCGTDGVAMGLCGLYQRTYLDDPDLGFAFLERFTRQGYAVEAAREVLRLAADRFSLGRLFAIVNPANARSLALLNKLGFVLDRIFVIPGESEESQLHQIEFAENR